MGAELAPSMAPNTLDGVTEPPGLLGKTRPGT